MLTAEELITVVIVGTGVICILSAIVYFVPVFAPWLQAYLSGVPLSVLDLVGMRMRKIDVRAVLRALILAHQAGAPLSSAEMQRACLQGADLEKVTLAFIRAKKEKLDITFKQLVEADLEDRLKEKLER